MDRRRFLQMIGLASAVVVFGGIIGGCSTPQSSPPATTKPIVAEPTKAPAPAAAPATASTPAAATNSKTVRFAFQPNADTAQDKGAKWFAQYLADKTNGQLKVDVFPGGQLGAERDQIDGHQMGSIEIGVSGTLLGTVAPEWGLVLDTPYVVRNTDQWRKVVDGPLGEPIKQALLKRKGIRLIANTNRGTRYLTTNQPVHVPDDLKGLKLRVPEQEAYVAAWKMLGATVTPMAWPEVFLGLKQGTIGAQENPLEVIYTSSLFEVQKYVNATSHISTGLQIVVSDKWYQSLPADQKKVVSDGLVEAGKVMDKYVADDEAGYEKKLQDKGMVWNRDVDLAKFQATLKDLPKQFESKWKPGFYGAVQSVK